MSYIERNLGVNEKILFEGKIHIITFLFPTLCTLVWATCIRSAFWGFLLVVIWLYYILRYCCTEIAVTNERLVAKQGILSVDSASVSLHAIEGVQVNISLLGLVLGYGTIIVSGKGTRKIGLPCVCSPEKFKKKLYSVIEQTKK